MLSMGSELGFSQGGNNNAYAQDNATSAIDWRAADASLIAFTTRLIAVRRANAALSRDAFLTGSPFDSSQLPDVEWRDANGPMTQAGWNDPEGAVMVAVFAAPQGERRRSSRRGDEPLERRRRASLAHAARRHGVAHPDRHA